MSTVLQTVRVAVRSLRRTPGLTALAIIILALGIGLSVAVFTIADGLLLRPLPVREQSRLVVLWGSAPNRPFDYPLGYANARDFVRDTRTLEAAAVFLYNGAGAVPVVSGNQVSRMRRALVSGAYFEVLGARPVLGRALRPADDVAGAAPAAVLSYAAWHRRFGADSHVLGRQIVLFGHGTAYTVVGVMPPGLDYPRGTDFWAPVATSMSADVLSKMAFYVLGRLAPGKAPVAAAHELTAFFRQPRINLLQHDLRGVATPWPRLVVGEVRPALIAFALAAGLLLLIACVNVAGLLLVRGLERVREMAVRSALGASRLRLALQLLAESAVLAAAGGALGVGVAAAAVRVFIRFAPPEVSRLAEIHLNATALAGAAGLATLAMLIAGLAPAIATSRVKLEAALRSSVRQTASRGARRGAEAMVAGQLALAMLVLAAAGVIGKSLLKLETVPLALEPSHLLIGDLALSPAEFADARTRRAMLERLVPQLEALPGIRAVSPVVASPYAGAGGWDGKLAAAGQTAAQAAANPMLNLDVVAPDYFTALGLPVLRGRGFTDRDDRGAPLAVVVSQSVARYFWPGEDPIGRRLRAGSGWQQVATVVGVVPDARYRALREARPTVYFTLRQSFFPFVPTTLAIRTTTRPAGVVPAIRRVITASEPGVALASIAPFESFRQAQLAQPRLDALLLVIFACAAVALAAVGLFGVMATMVRQRRRELGVRLALGASPADLGRMVLRRGVLIGLVGAGLGVLGSVAANRLLVALLYHVTPDDATTLAVVAALLLVVSALATVVPARLSTRVDPLIALRTE